MTYLIQKAPAPAAFPSDWSSPFWTPAEPLQISHFHPRSTSRHPRAEARALYDDRGLYLHFRVHDQFVRATFTEYQSPVCQDSCAEFFVQPRPDKGYFNFEINPLATLLLFYVEDPTRIGPELKKATRVPAELGRTVRIHPSLAEKPAAEIQSPLTWSLQYFVPFALFEHYLGPLSPVAGQEWRGNFYKCGDNTSKPHWASWADVGEALNFHQPSRFGRLVFAR